MTWPPSTVRLKIVRKGSVWCSFTLPLVLLAPALMALPVFMLAEAVLALPAIVVVCVQPPGLMVRLKRVAKFLFTAGVLREVLAMLVYVKGLKIHYETSTDTFLVELR